MINLKIFQNNKNIFLIFYFTNLKLITIDQKKDLTWFFILKKTQIREIIF